jgi:hypothetical protein
MFRKAAIAVSVLLLMFATACGSSKSATNTAAGGPGGSASPSASACPTENTRHFAKTRFTIDAGLAAGAFKRYIYTPYQAGKFKSGADGRKAAIAKAAVAAVFVLDQLRRAKNNAEANPTLCKVMVAPMRKLMASVQGLITKAKGGDLNAPDVTSSSGVLDGFRSAAQQAGAGFKDANPSLG